MRKVKIFTDSRGSLEKEINQWIEENPGIIVASINGTQYSEYETVTYVLYDTKPEGLLLS